MLSKRWAGIVIVGLSLGLVGCQPADPSESPAETGEAAAETGTAVTPAANGEAATETTSAMPAPGEKGAYPVTISYGKPIKLEDYVVSGKTTIFDFSSEYCPPCRAIAPKLAKLHVDREDIAVVTVNINRPDVKGIDWRSPVAQQFRLQSIPHFVIYGPDGTLKSEGDSAASQVMSWLG